MKLSEYAKKAGVSYKTAHRWWKAGQLKGYQIPATGTIIVETDEPVEVEPVALIYARVSSAEAKPNLERQATRLSDYATARGYRIYKVVKEVGSGLNDNRKLLTNALQDKNYNILVAEHRDRVTRFGLNYIKLLLSATGKRLEIVNDADNGKDELMQDLVSVITSFVQRIYGLRRAKRKTEKIITELHNNGGEG
ncbi:MULTISPECIES: IS607 family transposase [Cyanophyceae]|uniref:IS607 family transposase n=2 Tax=Cyanobacteriota TaxID=1117 RepID=UPI002331161C|nr:MULTISPECIES: IS607 family transposase [Cyanophyceae]MDB9356177.1 IS607 family transposase [Nodularia spumigena CS-587/03]MDB9303844.1 IS607 family transposase [Nodularia spumigena CS-591/12]MDB9321419.1 IS607 family transposase [Nodularia spumigena CS-591/07A]MDB9329888.1 IS607 family transposase [Nodularia spumigena CS-591/04]MDB9341535.1 IS607 family transposase [Nodularia spumigena CS-589/07]